MEESEDREFVKGAQGHLKKAGKIMDRLGHKHINVLQDTKGVFCIEYPTWYMIANGYVYKGSWISGQKEIVYRCLRKHKRLLVYIAEDDEFYLYHPQDIVDEHWENKRGYLTMYNWNYSIGDLLFEERKEAGKLPLEET